MRFCVLQDLFLKQTQTTIERAIIARLNNAKKEVFVSKKTCNRDWIKIASKKFDSQSIEIVVTTSFLAESCAEREKNRKTNFVDFSLETLRISIISSLTFSSIVLFDFFLSFFRVFFFVFFIVVIDRLIISVNVRNRSKSSHSHRNRRRLSLLKRI